MAAEKLDDYRVSDSELGLSRILGVKIDEIRGYLSTEFDDVVFKITRLALADGSFLGVEGEHDFPYVVQGGGRDHPGYTEEHLRRIYRLQKADDDTEEDLAP